MLVTMEQKAKAQILKGFYNYIKLIRNMDDIYNFHRIEDTLKQKGVELDEDVVRVLTVIDQYNRHGVLSHAATTVIDVKAKEKAEKEIAEARKTSKVDEYVQHERNVKNGESVLEYWTGVSGTAYGNVLANYNTRNNKVLDSSYDEFINIITSLSWGDIESSDIDVLLKQCSNAYYAVSNRTLNATPSVKRILTEQNFLCNYAGINTFTNIVITCDLFKETAKATFKPERVGLVIGDRYVKLMHDLSIRVNFINNDVFMYYHTLREYETVVLDIPKMTLSDALNINCKNMVVMSFAVKLTDDITLDDVANASDAMDAFLIDEHDKWLADKSYKPKYYVAVLDLMYNERALITDRFKNELVLRNEDAPNMKLQYKGKFNFEKLAIKYYHKTHKAVSRWILEQFDMDWDSGVYNSKRNGKVLTIADKSKAKGVVNL